MSPSHLLNNAKSLRKNMTKEEKHLWYDFLKGHRLHWYKQRIVGKYIFDFYCDFAKLAVELDGSQHFSEDGIKYDKERTSYLNSLGIKVLRFSNDEVNRNFEGVCGKIELESSQDLSVTFGDS